MSEIDAIIKRCAARIKDDRVYFSPSIPPSKLRNAITAYAPDIGGENVLALLDTTIMGNARYGLLLTRNALFFCNSEDKLVIRFDEIDHVSFSEGWPASVLRVNYMQLSWANVVAETSMHVIAQMLREMAETREHKPRIFRTVAEVVRHHSPTIKFNKIYFAPRIPPHKLQNAIQAYAPAVTAHEALVLVDTTVFGSAKTGGLLTPDAFYARNLGEKPSCIVLNQIDRVTYTEKAGLLVLSGRKFMRFNGGLPEGWRRFAQMLREIAAVTRPAPAPAVPLAPSEAVVDAPDQSGIPAVLSSGNIPAPQPVRINPETPGVTGCAAGAACSGVTSVSSGGLDLYRIETFLKKSLRDGYNAHLAPDIPYEKEQNIRSACNIPKNEKILALVTAENSGKRGVAFTHADIYVKKLFSEPMTIPYTALPARTYDSLREDMDGNGALSEDKMAVIAQSLKNIVMFGTADACKLPGDPDADPHPVKNWFKGASTFLVFVILTPWLLGMGMIRMGYPKVGQFLGLVCLLSWLTCFYSHQVKARKAKKHALFTILKRVAVGLMGAAAFAGAVLFDKYHSAPQGPSFSAAVTLVAVSLAGVALSMIVFFKVQKFFYEKRMESAVERVASRYLENERYAGVTGLAGLMNAGVCELDSDAHVRRACRVVSENSVDPLEQYNNLFAKVDLADFFAYSDKRGYDFDRYGDPKEIISQLT